MVLAGEKITLLYILGTAQFGLDYGVNNVVGKPSEDEVFSLLSTAYDNGITALDTAARYGDSERLIGKFQSVAGKMFDLHSKFSGEGSLADEVQLTLKNLCVDRLSLYYLHRYDDCSDNSIIDVLKALKADGVIERIGISVYTCDELFYVLDNLNDIVDVVQIPFSVVDCARWVSALKAADDAGMMIYCRSIFLQGALFKSLDDGFIAKYNAGGHLRVVHDMCVKYNCSVECFAISFVAGFEGISGILFGCETLEQLRRNIDMQRNAIDISKCDFDFVVDKMKDVSPEFIDPRQWKE